MVMAAVAFKASSREAEMDMPIIDQVVEQLRALPEDQQRRVLQFALSLAIAPLQGVPGPHLLRFAGILSDDDAQLMRHAVEDGCGRVDADEW